VISRVTTERKTNASGKILAHDNIIRVCYVVVVVAAVVVAVEEEEEEQQQQQELQNP
jgi:hypothetical protein